MKYFIAFLFVFITGCSSQQIIDKDDSIIHSYSGAKFKSHLGSFIRGGQEKYDDEGKNISFSYYCNVNYPVMLSIYVYPVSDDYIYKQYPEGTEINYQELLQEHFNLCKNEITKAGKEDPSLKTTLLTEDKQKINKVDFLTAIYDCEMRGEKYESSIYLTYFRNCFFKVRITYDKNHNSEIYGMVKYLLRDINWEDAGLDMDMKL